MSRTKLNCQINLEHPVYATTTDNNFTNHDYGLLFIFVQYYKSTTVNSILSSKTSLSLINDLDADDNDDYDNLKGKNNEKQQKNGSSIPN